jgi:hypothetical protein
MTSTTIPVAEFLIDTEAPGITALCASVTLPESDAPETWAQTGTEIVNPSAKTAAQTMVLITLRDIEGLLFWFVPERIKESGREYESKALKGGASVSRARRECQIGGADIDK